MKWIIAGIASTALFAACATIPEGATVVKPFDKNKYLGKWYEIARMPSRFEKNLEQVTATYSLKNDGSIKVVNSGFNSEKQKQSTAEGKAKFRNGDSSGALKVSFFGPFYAAYNVIAVEDDYRYALVAGKNLNYLWMLSRTKELPEQVRTSFIQRAVQIGYDTTKLVWVKQ